MNWEEECYNTDDEYDNESLQSDDDMPDGMWENDDLLSREELSSIPQIIDAGDGKVNVFRIIPYALDEDRNITQNCFIKIYNDRLFKLWWMNKLKHMVLNRAGNMAGIKRNHKKSYIYTWTYYLSSSDESDPNRWQIYISKQYKSFLQDERYCGTMNVIVETDDKNRGKMTFSMNIKTGEGNWFNQINFNTQLTNSEYRSLPISGDS